MIVADADAPGQRGAESLAAVLVAYSPSVRDYHAPGRREGCAGVEAARGDGGRRASGNRRGPGSEAGGFGSHSERQVCIMEDEQRTDD